MLWRVRLWILCETESEGSTVRRVHWGNEAGGASSSISLKPWILLCLSSFTRLIPYTSDFHRPRLFPLSSPPPLSPRPTVAGRNTMNHWFSRMHFPAPGNLISCFCSCQLIGVYVKQSVSYNLFFIPSLLHVLCLFCMFARHCLEWNGPTLGRLKDERVLVLGSRSEQHLQHEPFNVIWKHWETPVWTMACVRGGVFWNGKSTLLTEGVSHSSHRRL